MSDINQPQQSPQSVMEATATPKNKVIAATTGAAVGSSIAVILVWILKSILHQNGIDLTDDVSAALGVIITAIVTMATGYYTPPGATEGVLVDATGNVKSALKTKP